MSCMTQGHRRLQLHACTSFPSLRMRASYIMSDDPGATTDDATHPCTCCMRKQIKALWEPFIEILDCPTVLPLPFWCSSCLHFYALVKFFDFDLHFLHVFTNSMKSQILSLALNTVGVWKILAGGFNSPILQQLLLFTLCEHAQAQKVAQIRCPLNTK